jgi:hypothetical protein
MNTMTEMEEKLLVEQKFPDVSKLVTAKQNLDFGVNKQVENVYKPDTYNTYLEKRYEKYTRDLNVEFTKEQRAALKQAVPAKINPSKSKENTDKFLSRLSQEMVAAQEAVAKLMVDENGQPLKNWAIYGSGSIDYEVSGVRDDVDVFYDVLDARQIKKNLENASNVFPTANATENRFEESIIDIYGKTHKFHFWVEVEVVIEGEKKRERIEVEIMGEGVTQDGKFSGTGQIGYKECVEIDQREFPSGTIVNYMSDKDQNIGYAVYALREALLENVKSQKNPIENKAKLAARLIKFYEKGNTTIQSIIDIIEAAVESYPVELRTTVLEKVLSNKDILVKALQKIQLDYEVSMPSPRDISKIGYDPSAEKKKDMGFFLSELKASKYRLSEGLDTLFELSEKGNLKVYLDLMKNMMDDVEKFDLLKKYHLSQKEESSELLFFILEQYLSDFVGDFSLVADVALDEIVVNNRYEPLTQEQRAKYIEIEKFLHRYRNYSTVSLKK